MKVIIDTNGFMIPVQFGVDIFEELKRLGFDEFFVPEAVVFEIEKLIKRERGSNRAASVSACNSYTEHHRSRAMELTTRQKNKLDFV